MPEPLERSFLSVLKSIDTAKREFLKMDSHFPNLLQRSFTVFLKKHLCQIFCHSSHDFSPPLAHPLIMFDTAGLEFAPPKQTL